MLVVVNSINCFVKCGFDEDVDYVKYISYDPDENDTDAFEAAKNRTKGRILDERCPCGCVDQDEPSEFLYLKKLWGKRYPSLGVIDVDTITHIMVSALFDWERERNRNLVTVHTPT